MIFEGITNILGCMGIGAAMAILIPVQPYSAVATVVGCIVFLSCRLRHSDLR